MPGRLRRRLLDEREEARVRRRVLDAFARRRMRVPARAPEFAVAAADERAVRRRPEREVAGAAQLEERIERVGDVGVGPLELREVDGMEALVVASARRAERQELEA